MYSPQLVKNVVFIIAKLSSTPEVKPNVDKLICGVPAAGLLAVDPLAVCGIVPGAGLADPGVMTTGLAGTDEVPVVGGLTVRFELTTVDLLLPFTVVFAAVPEALDVGIALGLLVDELLACASLWKGDFKRFQAVL